MSRVLAPSVLAALLVLALAPTGAVAQVQLATPPNPYGEVPPDVTPAPPPAPPAVTPAPSATGVRVACVTAAGQPVACPQVVVVATGPTTVYGSAPAKEAPDPGPTPASGFLGRSRSLQVRLELGYPFMDFGFDYVLGSRVSIGVGMRSLYSLSFAPYASLRFQLAANAARTVGLTLGLKAGYTALREDYEDVGVLIGGSRGFGELSLGATARRRRHGLLVQVGVRIDQVRSEEYYDCYYEDCGGSRKPGATVFAELGWEVRIGHHASYYLGLGVDMFTGSELPAMVRFRNGVIIDF